MRITTTVPSQPRGRRVLAATAALGLALTLSACGNDDGGDADTGTATATATDTGADGGAEGGTEENGAEGTGDDGEETVAEEPAAGAGDRAEGAPDAPIEQLVLNDQDAPGFGLVPIPADQIAEGVKAMGGMAEGAKVDPPECSDFNQEAMDAQAAPGTTAIQTGQTGQSPVAVAVTTVSDGIAKQKDMVDRCPVMTVTLPFEGGEATVETRNETLPYDAPEDVDAFAAISQQSTMDLAGTQQSTNNVVFNGVVRGIGVTVTVSAPAGDVPQEARDAGMDAFTKQVEKIKNA